MGFDEVQIDVLFAQLNVMYLDKPLEEIILDSEKIFSLIEDEKSLTSINGILTCSAILKAVPDVNNFQETLKYVKLWAKNKGLYSNIMGQIGGISWAIMVAKICQMYPQYKPSKLIERFFMIYSQWDWEEMSVIIEEIDESLRDNYLLKMNFLKDSSLELSEKNVMNIIIPCFPFKNSSYSVTSMTLKVIKDHFQEAVMILNNIKQGLIDWKNLFETYNFFMDFTKFIKINIFEKNQERINQNVEKNVETEEFLKWRGIVESKLRKLNKLLESNILCTYLDICFYPVAFSSGDKHAKNSLIYYYGLRMRQKSEFDFDKSKFLNFFPLISWFVENLERGEKISTEMVLDISLVKYSKIEKKHLKDLETNKSLFNRFQGKIAKNHPTSSTSCLKMEKNKLYSDNEYFKKSYFSDRMMNDFCDYGNQNSILSAKKKVQYLF